MASPPSSDPAPTCSMPDGPSSTSWKVVAGISEPALVSAGRCLYRAGRVESSAGRRIFRARPIGQGAHANWGDPSFVWSPFLPGKRRAFICRSGACAIKTEPKAPRFLRSNDRSQARQRLARLWRRATDAAASHGLKRLALKRSKMGWSSRRDSNA